MFIQFKHPGILAGQWEKYFGSGGPVCAPSEVTSEVVLLGSNSCRKFSLVERSQLLLMQMQKAAQREKSVYSSPGSENNSYLSMQKLSWCVHSKEWKEIIERSSALWLLSFTKQTSFNSACQYFVDSGSRVADKGKHLSDSVKILENALNKIILECLMW